MKFFDSVLNEFLNSISSFNIKENQTFKPWKDAGRSEFIMQRDCAIELKGTGFNIVTSSDIGNDKIVLVGKDLNELKGEVSYARVSVIQIDDISDEQKAYNTIRKIEFSKYHCFPEGFMTRAQADTCNESVRVSKKSVKDGLSFENTGALLIKKYKENPSVKAVAVYYITDQTYDYKSADTLAHKSKDILDTLNHIMKDVTLDCNSCALKPVCDEVEGLRELHFGNTKN